MPHALRAHEVYTVTTSDPGTCVAQHTPHSTPAEPALMAKSQGAATATQAAPPQRLTLPQGCPALSLHLAAAAPLQENLYIQHLYVNDLPGSEGLCSLHGSV